ncbi:MAG: 4-hydroxy-tetrahydrodipicolinate synthase [Bacteroidales bacterium]|nr:4-hydroxy-tetrahydrodipicolinate synthase [Bacteroidales bacterium]
MHTYPFTGTGVALVTPFTQDLKIDFDALESIVNHVIDGKVDYLVVLGTTGETPTLSFEEKCLVLKKVLEVNANRLPVLYGIGGNHTAEVCDAIEKTDFSGVQGLLSVVPYYNKPSQEGLIRHFSVIAEKSPVPVVLYNVPTRTVTNLNAETALTLARECPNIVAVKEASGNLGQMMEILKGAPEHFSLISGDDGLTLPIMAMGGAGVISVAANAFPAQISSMVRLASSGDFEGARKIHYALMDFYAALFCEGNPVGVKAVMEILGICGNIFRLPLVPVSKQTYERLKSLSEYVKTI